MHCEKCGQQIAPGDDVHHLGRTLCEDCGIDVLFPARACDPWVVYTARSMTTTGSALTGLQQKIIAVVAATSGIEPKVLARKVNITTDELQRELATLRHMEKIRARMAGDRKVICLW